jgi:hypothetical protein
MGGGRIPVGAPTAVRVIDADGHEKPVKAFDFPDAVVTLEGRRAVVSTSGGGVPVIEDPGNVWEAETAVAAGYRIAVTSGGFTGTWVFEVSDFAFGTTDAMEPTWDDGASLPLFQVGEAEVTWYLVGLVGDPEVSLIREGTGIIAYEQRLKLGGEDIRFVADEAVDIETGETLRVTLDGDQGSAGQALVSDGGGKTVWGSVPASAIPILDADDDFTATDVEGALAELQADAEAHVAASDPHAGYVQEADADWVELTGAGETALHSHAGGGGAPTDADYLVGTAQGGLSAEIVVGTSPGGELGGTWGSPTVDASHSGSTHAATQAAAEATAAAALAGHVAAGDPHTGYRLESADHTHASSGLQAGTIDHGVLTGLSDDDHPQYALDTDLTTHAGAADPHTGYVLESLLDAKGDIIAASADNTPAKVTVGANDTILMADSGQTAGVKWVAPATTPSTQAFGDAAAGGSSDDFTRGDHKHAMPANPVTAHEAASDPHTGYVREADANWVDLTDGGDTSLHSHAGGGAGDLVFIDTPNDVAINSTSDVTINTRDVTSVSAGDQLIVDAWATILNNSGATRNIILTLDFDAAFDIELTLPALATSSTLLHPVHIYGILDVRASNLAYAMIFADMQLAAGIASGTDTSAAATHLQAKGWGTTASDLTGTVTVALKARSANATATQTLRLHSHTIRKVTPT